MSVNIQYNKGWKPGCTSNDIKQVNNKYDIYFKVRLENGWFVCLDKQTMFGCGDGNTTYFAVYFLNDDGNVEYYNFNDSCVIQNLVTNKTNDSYEDIVEYIENCEPKEWILYPVYWSDLQINNTNNFI